MNRGLHPEVPEPSASLLQWCSEHDHDQIAAKREQARFNKIAHATYKEGYQKEARKAEALRQRQILEMKRTRDAALQQKAEAKHESLQAVKGRIGVRRNKRSEWLQTQQDKHQRQVRQAQSARSKAKKAWADEKARQQAEAAAKVRVLRRQNKERSEALAARLERERKQRVADRRRAMKEVNAELDAELRAIEEAHLREARDRKVEFQQARQKFIKTVESMDVTQHDVMAKWSAEQRAELEVANKLRQEQWAARRAELEREWEARLVAKAEQEKRARDRANSEYARRVEIINAQAEVERAEVEAARSRATLESKLHNMVQHDTAVKHNAKEHAKVLPALKSLAQQQRELFERQRRAEAGERKLLLSAKADGLVRDTTRQFRTQLRSASDLRLEAAAAGSPTPA